MRVTHRRHRTQAALNASHSKRSETIERLQGVGANQRPSFNENRRALAVVCAGRSQDGRAVRRAVWVSMDAVSGERGLQGRRQALPCVSIQSNTQRPVTMQTGARKHHKRAWESERSAELCNRHQGFVC